MRRQARALTLTWLVSLALATIAAAPAAADFGLKDLDFSFEKEGGSPAAQAGSHPFSVTTAIAVNAKPDPEQGELPEGSLKDLRVDLPPGLVGDRDALPKCSDADFATIVNAGTTCGDESAVGFADLKIALPFEAPTTYRVAVYSLDPTPGTAARFGLVALGVPVTFSAGVNPDPPHNLFVSVKSIAQPVRFFTSVVRIWGNPASPVHDDERGRCATSNDECPVELPEKPFLTLPRSCAGPLPVRFGARSWQDPGTWLDYPIQTAEEIDGCAELDFSPEISSTPTTGAADSPSGLDFHLEIDDKGLTSPAEDAKADSDIKKAVVTLPEGVTVNPSAAAGLAACSEAGFAAESVDSEPGEGCPQASKIGEVEVETPLLEGELLRGAVFVAAQDQNPFHSMLALYMVIKDPGLGILVKLPGRVDLDPRTGQLLTTFGEPPYEIPQFPFSHLRFRFRAGPRAPLVTPRVCAKYETKAVFTPWANPGVPYTATADFEIDRGVGGGVCGAGGAPPFAPAFEAGSIDNKAGSYSPFFMRLTRDDGEQEITRFSSVLPAGLLAKIAGLAKCPDSAVAAARVKSGRAELASPSCSEASRIGRTLGGAGVGSVLTHVPGALYLGGPYGGDPLSVIAITPALAGPFDVGTVVVRVGLGLDPDTAQVQVNGARSDPIPHILAGIPLRLRDLRVYADRPEFTLNPTSCQPSAARATLWGGGSDAFSVEDDVAMPLAARFQAAGCAALRFAPKLRLRLIGATRRAANPKLIATLRARPGEANIARAQVRLPRAAFLDNSHIATICTRLQFAAGQCPAASVYGRASARTPLLDDLLSGPVYLRSSTHQLPDLVVKLRGPESAPVEVELAGRTDSVKGALRTTFEAVPDAPVSRFRLELFGGRRGLIELSRNLCAHPYRATVRLDGHNGKLHDIHPLVGKSCKDDHRGSYRQPAHSR
jgi:hypothetical protein